MQCADEDLINRLAGQKQHHSRGQWDPAKKVPPESQEAEEDPEEDPEEEEDEEDEQARKEAKEKVKQYE